MKTAAQAVAECQDIGTTRFRAFMPFVLDAETEFAFTHWGDYDYIRTENVDGDSGGETRLGIDAASHPGVDIGSLTVRQALQIYFTDDWTACGAESFPQGYGEVLCDIHINGGDGPTMLQRGLNTLGAGLVVDGQLGPKSRASMARYGDAGVKAFIAQRDARFDALADNVGHDAQFLQGWLDRDKNLKAVLGLA